jgi:uncharacterized protein YhjY with autotransporter beta-barrel domain
MLPIPQIQINQQYGQLGINADLGTFDMQQPRPTMEITTTRPKLEQQTTPGLMTIDQSKAWDAMAIGPHLEVMNRIYSQAKDIALQGVARIVQEGNRLADILHGNAIADIAANYKFEFSEFDFAGPSSFLNVSTRYIPAHTDLEVQDGSIQMNTQVNKPQVNYNRGKLDIYMLQYPKVVITPPQIDLKR